MALPHPNISPIPNNEPDAVPSLWNTRYQEIDENFADHESRLAAELAVAPSECFASSGKMLHMAQAFRATIISAPDSRRTRSTVARFRSSSSSSRT